jgi:hypothetical protein
MELAGTRTGDLLGAMHRQPMWRVTMGDRLPVFTGDSASAPTAASRSRGCECTRLVPARDARFHQPPIP